MVQVKGCVNVIDTNLYYRLGDVLSRNGVYNFIVGGRGIGKTYSAKNQVIRNFIKRGDQFIYLRRYKTELSTRLTFFTDIAHEFPEYGFRIHGMEAQMTRNPKDEKPTWETMGYFMALSNSQSKKSVSYLRVTIIIFDEFIIEKGAVQYLPNESRVFNDLFSTVDRFKDKTRVLFLANSVSIMNPYFLAYKIQPTDGVEWMTFNDGFIVCQFPNDADFADAVKQTRFGKFIDGTEYGDYSIGNNFKDNSDALIALKPSHAKYQMTLETELGIFSIWFTGSFGDPESRTRFYVQEKRPKDENLYTLQFARMDENKVLLLPGDRILAYLRSAFRGGRVYFDSPTTRNMFGAIFKR